MKWLGNGTAVAAILVGLLSSVSGHGQEASDFQLSLIREYGRAHFSRCRLDLVAYSGKGTASLICDYAGVDGKGRSIAPLAAREELIPAETKRLTDLVRRSALYDGEHIGSDSTPGDSIFELLKLRTNGRTVSHRLG
jgi:hypothetical protein